MTPRTREHFLYDDIIDSRHRPAGAPAVRGRSWSDSPPSTRCATCWRTIAATAEVRDLLIHETTNIVPSAPLARELADLAPADTGSDVDRGAGRAAGPAGCGAQRAWVRPCRPLPNLFFTRDAAMAINDHVMVGAMRYRARWTEELIMKMLFLHHPRPGQLRRARTTGRPSGATTTRWRGAMSIRCGVTPWPLDSANGRARPPSTRWSSCCFATRRSRM